MAKRSPMRVRLLHPLSAIAILLGILALPGMTPVGTAAPDGTVTIEVWTCPTGISVDPADAKALAAACTTKASNLTFFLSFAGVDIPLARKTDYPVAGSGKVSWTPPFTGPVTIKLDKPPAGVISVAFCDQGKGEQPTPITDGATLVSNFTVPAAGMACRWFLVPSNDLAKPTPKATTVPTNTPAPLPTATATAAATPTAAASPAAAGPTYDYTFVAIDPQGHRLPGACYAVDGGEPHCDDDGDGAVGFTLATGDHVLIETRPPDGFRGTINATFTAIEGGGQFVVPFQPIPGANTEPTATPAPSAASPAPTMSSTASSATGPGSLTLSSADEQGNPLPVVCYTVTGTGENNLGQECDVDGDGSVVLTGVPADTYTVAQSSVPEGYRVNPQSQTVEIKPGAEAKLAFVSARVGNGPAPTKAPTAQAGNQPREFSYQGEYYLRDQVVPLARSQLIEVTAYKTLIVYAHSADAPFTALYIPVSKRTADGMIRYLPENMTQLDQPCPSEDGRRSIPSPWTLSDGSIYVFGGYETDIPGSAMSVLASNVFYQTGSALPLAQIFVKTDVGYERWMRISADQEGLLDQLGPGLSFAGQALTYKETRTDATGIGQLIRVGCAGPFRVDAVIGEDAPPFHTLYIHVGDRLLVYEAKQP